MTIEKKYSKKYKIFSNNWVVTLTATLIGVFLALYMSEIVSSSKLKNQKSIATKNILLEIEENKKNIEKNIKNHQAILGTYEFMEKYMDDENRMITDIGSMQKFRSKFPNIFTAQDSTLLDNGKYHYKGEVNVDFGLSQINVTNIAWETLKNSGLSTSYDFNCLMFLEKLVRVTEETITQERKFFEILKTPKNIHNNDSKEKLKIELKLLIDYENGLLEGYKSSEEKLSNCG